MRAQARDLSLDAEAIVIERLRQMTPSQKLQAMQDLIDCAVQIQTAEIKSRHPAIGEEELEMRLRARWLPADSFKRWYGWDVKVNGY